MEKKVIRIDLDNPDDLIALVRDLNYDNVCNLIDALRKEIAEAEDEEYEAVLIIAGLVICNEASRIMDELTAEEGKLWASDEATYNELRTPRECN